MPMTPASFSQGRPDMDRSRELRSLSRAQGKLPSDIAMDEECDCGRIFRPSEPGQVQCRPCRHRQAAS